MIGMPRGLKETSGIVAISARAEESAPNTFTQESIDLNLDPLNNEVFVVVAVDLNPSFPDAEPSTDTASQACLSVTSRTTMGFIEDNNVLASASTAIRAKGYSDSGVGFTQQSLETPPSNLEYIGIIATNDMFLSIEGLNNVAVKAVGCRVWGYRAKADAAIYAALVQSEVLSA
ncbi:MAG: hypothetical protein [Circular genetic element sp.]|nr:MAG: hypothetical protein [Circular genetic element sp.]